MISIVSIIYIIAPKYTKNGKPIVVIVIVKIIRQNDVYCDIIKTIS